MSSSRGSGAGRAGQGGSQQHAATPSSGGAANSRSGSGKGSGKGKGKGQRNGQGKASGGGNRGRQKPRNASGNERIDELAGPLSRVLDRLPATQRSVIEYRMGLKDGHPHDLGDTARALGLSLSEARDIERRAFEHIREVVPLERLQKLLKGS